MLLKSVVVSNRAGLELELPLENDGSGFKVRNIDGLDPVQATLVSSSFANQDGEQYHTSRRVTRNIKLELSLDPNYAAESVKNLRDELYQFFMPKSPVWFKFTLFDKFTTIPEKRLRDFYIDGIVEIFDSPLFTSDPVANISTIEYDPDFHDLNTTIFNGLTTNGSETQALAYEGSVDTGLLLTLPVTADCPEFTISNSMPGDETPSQVAQIVYDFKAGDLLMFSSLREHKYVHLGRSGDISSILYAMQPDSAWVQLTPGVNNLRVATVADPMEFMIQYTNRYGGL